ncbi:phospholipase D-like domain-containing protein [Nocardia arizonensis]|uniref:phospholipase D-like domain-containing protein n=1 Tax=Nocardia arizonensis TaxID=1141647 RepID=UPI0006D01F52|nr:phospholipase D-like domain-containing protein [Nocardia arizonensis]
MVAISGVNTVSFAVLASDELKDGLLGFAVERIDPTEHERYYMAGFKVFESVIPHPHPGAQVSTFEHPVQSFVWDDFTAKPDRDYEYLFHPVKGEPKNLDRSARPLSVTVHTEPLFGDGVHDVFFNRGIAGSQAYVRRFGSTPITELRPEVRAAALRWLSRDLEVALLRFIDDCASGDRLLCCFYEFRHEPAARALKSAVDRGVDVHIIVDAKDNESGEGGGAGAGAFPRDANLAMIAEVGIPAANIVLREARASAIQHNKFMVRVTGEGPSEVWTGSTNLSQGGLAGQTNVGHRVRDAAVAQRYLDYWRLLSADPGGTESDPPSEVRRKNKLFRTAVQELSPAPDDLRAVPAGVTAVFSPRPTDAVLLSYSRLLDTARRQGCLTLAFGIGATFKDLLADNTVRDGLIFLLLEKRDKPDRDHPEAFVALNAANNVYQAWGSFLHGPVYQWTEETNAGLLGLNQHVSYIHCKFMLIDPLGADPLVVTGSANFSEASTKDNDENMLVIRGDTRVADIYFTEFNRLFNYYYFRSVAESMGTRRGVGDGVSGFLAENSTWQKKYSPGSFRAERLRLYAEMPIGRDHR